MKLSGWRAKVSLKHLACGLALDALEEPAFSPEVADGQRPLSWDSLWQIPPVLVGRLR
jgi:hypothetical protein